MQPQCSRNAAAMPPQYRRNTAAIPPQNLLIRNQIDFLVCPIESRGWGGYTNSVHYYLLFHAKE